MTNSATESDAYKKVDVQTASQGKLIVMLFNGAIQRAEEAKRQIDKGSTEGVHNNLIRAQEIVAELRSSLNVKAGEIAQNLDRIYEYFQHLLVKANLRKTGAPIDECVELMTEMRDTWQELFDKIQREQPLVQAPPKMDPHGAAVMNMQG